jgi:hypothetical protein
MSKLWRSQSGLLLLVLLVWSPGAAFAQEADPWEFWPELNLLKKANPTTRFYFVASYAEGKESQFRTLDLAGYLDVTIGPHVPHSRQKADWQTKKYFWARVGYDHIFKAEGETSAPPEHRGIVSIFARHYLPGGVLVEGRARADLRWLESGYSTRYRFRVEVNRDFEVFDRVVTPYFQAEYFYDTRYDAWARELYQLGAEMEVTRHFRVEPSVARQVDVLQPRSGLWAFGFVARWYY